MRQCPRMSMAAAASPLPACIPGLPLPPCKIPCELSQAHHVPSTRGAAPESHRERIGWAVSKEQRDGVSLLFSPNCSLLLKSLEFTGSVKGSYTNTCACLSCAEPRCCAVWGADRSSGLTGGWGLGRSLFLAVSSFVSHSKE